MDTTQSSPLDRTFRKGATAAALRYHKSSFSEDSYCVEVALCDGGVAVRDSKNVDNGSATLVYTAEEWNAFLAGVKAGEFDQESLSSKLA